MNHGARVLLERADAAGVSHATIREAARVALPAAAERANASWDVLLNTPKGDPLRAAAEREHLSAASLHCTLLALVEESE